jgi:hypothetical protein
MERIYLGRVPQKSIIVTQYPLLPTKEAEQKGALEIETGLDVNPAQGLHDQRPCSDRSRHNGRERGRPL